MKKFIAIILVLSIVLMGCSSFTEGFKKGYDDATTTSSDESK